MMVPARFRKIAARCHRPISDVGEARQLIFGQLHHEVPAAALHRGLAEHERGEQRAGDPGNIEAEQHQPLQADARADRRSPG